MQTVGRSQMTNIAATDINSVLRQLAFGPDLVVPLVREVPPAILKRRIDPRRIALRALHGIGPTNSTRVLSPVAFSILP